MPINFSIDRKGRTFKAKANSDPPFFVGYQTSYTDKTTGEDFEGLYNVPTAALPKFLYDPGTFRNIYGFWADFIWPTSRCEGGNFLTLNTYDNARFTWGFGQFGAHVPDGDFIVFFRDMLSRPEAPDYFPNLRLNERRIVKVQGETLVPMETAATTVPLMDYLNPTKVAIEDAEVIAAAKFIHWTTNNVAAQQLQALHMVGTFKRLLKEADARLGLDGRTADICCVICDIRHQGRAKFAAMLEALNKPKPLQELLKLGSIAYPDRIKTLKGALKDAEALFAAKKWSRTKGEFV